MTKTSNKVVPIAKGRALRRKVGGRSPAVGTAQAAMPASRNRLLTAKQIEANRLLTGPQRHTLLVGGSRSGKTFILVRAIIVRALRAPGSRHVIFRFRYNALRASVWLDTWVKVLDTCFPGLRERCKPNQNDGYVELPNGAQVWFCGLDDKERVEKVLGMEFATMLFNECSQIPYASVLIALTRLAQKTVLMARAYYDLNPTGTGHWTYLLFFKHKDPIDRLRDVHNPHDYAALFMNPVDNRDNIDPAYIDMLNAMPERQRKRFLEGRYVNEIDGQMWSLECIERSRIALDDVPKDLVRITVNVDPSGCSGKEDERSDEVGITVTARHDRGNELSHGYLLADLSGRYSPEAWGRLACRLYHDWNADTVIGEKNFGGDMVRSTIQASDRNVPVKLVTASRGKVQRAEPISALYEQNRMFHAGKFDVLEDQLCNFSTSGYRGDRSPDRADSAIWGFTELMVGESTTGLLEYYRAKRAQQEEDAKNGKR